MVTHRQCICSKSYSQSTVVAGELPISGNVADLNISQYRKGYFTCSHHRMRLHSNLDTR